MTYEEAKSIRDSLEIKVKEAGKGLDHFPRGNMGLIPDVVKNTSEYKIAKKKFDVAFKALQNFNSVFVKTFRKEIRQNRKFKGA